MEFVLILLALVVVALVLVAPLRGRDPEGERSAREADLETARDAKYAEIREAELDFRTGKLSRADWRALDGELRREAVDILRELDELQGR